MTSDTRRVGRELALGVVLVFAAVLMALLLVPGLASARETDGSSDRSSNAAGISSLSSRTTNANFRGGHFGIRGPLGSSAVETTAELTSTTNDQVTAALQDGQTLADYAESHGVAEATLVEAIVTAETARIDQAVIDGTLTQERADELKVDLTERVTEKVNRAGGPGGCPNKDGEDPDDSETQST